MIDLESLKIINLKKLDDIQLVNKISYLKKSLFLLRTQISIGQLDAQRKLNLIKKSIARIYTLINERSLSIK